MHALFLHRNLNFIVKIRSIKYPKTTIIQTQTTLNTELCSISKVVYDVARSDRLISDLARTVRGSLRENFDRCETGIVFLLICIFKSEDIY